MPSDEPITVRDATLDDLGVVASWVSTADECRMWAGPLVSYPIDQGRLAAETEFAAAVDLALAAAGGVVAFGQLLRRPPHRVHLARVIVRPDARGRGIGRALVRALLARALADGAKLATLYVYVENAAAVRLYEAAGFRPAMPPARDARTPGALFMTRGLGRP